MTKRIMVLVLVTMAILSEAQAPLKFNYQAVARDGQGAILPSQNIRIRASILDGNPNGVSQYTETHDVSTSQLGLFNLSIGGGSVVSGSFSNINWSNGDKYIMIEMDVNGGNNFSLVGTSQLLSVPYAVYAERTNLVGGNGIDVSNNVISNTGDEDNNPTNEMQTLSINGDVLSISNSNSVTLPSSDIAIQSGNGINVNQNGDIYTIANTGDLSNSNELQTLSLNGNSLSISNGNNVTGDFSESNELQTLSLSGNTLSISNGNSVSLPNGGSGSSDVIAPSFSTTEILNLQNVAVGTIVFNTTDNALYYYSGMNWYKLDATILTDPGSHIVTDCLVAYYNFDDGTAADVWGIYEGNNTGVEFSDDVNSKINSGKSATFDGTDKISVPDNPLYNLTQGSISFWYKGTAGGPILYGTTSTNSGAYTVRTLSNSGVTKLIYAASGVSFDEDITPYLNGVWNHFVITISSTERKLYINGGPIQTIPNNQGMTGTNFNQGMTIGDYPASQNVDNLVGKLDNLRIYCDALTPDEVSLLYNNGQ